MLETSRASEETPACTALLTGENAKNTDFLLDRFTLSVHSSDKS